MNNDSIFIQTKALAESILVTSTEIQISRECSANEKEHRTAWATTTPNEKHILIPKSSIEEIFHNQGNHKTIIKFKKGNKVNYYTLLTESRTDSELLLKHIQNTFGFSRQNRTRKLTDMIYGQEFSFKLIVLFLLFVSVFTYYCFGTEELDKIHLNQPSTWLYITSVRSPFSVIIGSFFIIIPLLYSSYNDIKKYPQVTILKSY